MEFVVGTLVRDPGPGSDGTKHAHAMSSLEEILVGRGALVASKDAAQGQGGGIPPIARHLPRSEFSVSPSAGYLTATPSEAYDFLYADNCLQHCDDPYATLADWIRVVRPGGLIALTLPLASGGEGEETWTFALPTPSALGERVVGVFDLLETVCHLAEPWGLSVLDANEADAAPRSVEIIARKRERALTPVQSNASPTADLLLGMTESAIRARHRWHALDEFDEILADGVLDNTVVDVSRLYLLYQWLLSTRALTGDCIEVGSYRGGTAKLISETLLRRGFDANLFVFDTFEGMPDRFAADEQGLRGTFKETSEAAVRALLANNGRAHVIKGVFPESLPRHLDRATFRLAHVDVDIERSVHDSCAFIYPRLVPGGVMIFDDYGHSECAGATRAVEAFFNGTDETIVQMPLLSSAVVIKRG